MKRLAKNKIQIALQKTMPSETVKSKKLKRKIREGREEEEKEQNVEIIWVTRCKARIEEGGLAHLGTAITRDQITTFVSKDCDVYDSETKKLLARYRTGVLSQENIDLFYENVIKMANGKSNFRRKAAGKVHVKSNIFGYYDKFGPHVHTALKGSEYKPKMRVRECAFNIKHPNKYINTFPLIGEINNLFAAFVPHSYNMQMEKAAEKPCFQIASTCFTTITTNINFQTNVHIDKNDFEEGFGNLVVIEKNGKYIGGETCFPEYGIGFDVRMGSILFMDVHIPHANLPIVLENPSAIRLSIVCYLRPGIFAKASTFSNDECMEHLKKLSDYIK